MTAALRRSFSPDELAVRLHQQELVAHFGLSALQRPSAEGLLQEACISAASGLRTPMAKVLRYRPDADDFLVVAGVGWQPGVVGHSTLPGGSGSPAGYAMLTRQPAVSNSLTEETRFAVPALLTRHGVQSAINVVIGTGGTTFGVLEVDSTHRHEFEAADTTFLQSFANVIAAALVRAEAEQAKDALLRDKDLLMQEVHHRVKNSLQMVQTMLQLQARDASAETRRHLDGASGRIMSIGAVHQRLYSGRSVHQADAAEFLTGLLADLRAMLAGNASTRSITLDAPSIPLPADAITPLGLVVSELVTNATKYGAGSIRVRVAALDSGLEIAVEDDGPGFPADFQPGSGSGLGMRLLGALARGVPDAVRIDRSVPYGRVVVLLRH